MVLFYCWASAFYIFVFHCKDQRFLNFSSNLTMKWNEMKWETVLEFTKSYFTSNQCLNGSQPNVWMTIFLMLKLLVEWTVWRWPGVPQVEHLTPDSATQQVSRKGQEPRHLGHTAPSEPLTLFLSLSSDPLLCLSILLAGGGGCWLTELRETEETDFPLLLKVFFPKPLSRFKNFS